MFIRKTQKLFLLIGCFLIALLFYPKEPSAYLHK